MWMRKVNFKVRNIGSEKYLSYVLDDETDLDEELLDYLDDNKIEELIDIIYEEDDENDYLTSNVTGFTYVKSLFRITYETGIPRSRIFIIPDATPLIIPSIISACIVPERRIV